MSVCDDENGKDPSSTDFIGNSSNYNKGAAHINSITVVAGHKKFQKVILGLTFPIQCMQLVFLLAPLLQPLTWCHFDNRIICSVDFMGKSFV